MRDWLLDSENCKAIEDHKFAQNKYMRASDDKPSAPHCSAIEQTQRSFGVATLGGGSVAIALLAPNNESV